MATRFSILVVCAVLAATAQAVPLNTADAQSCAELCASCKGVATFDGDQCECNIEGNSSEGAECVSRMKRQAEERGLNLLSCDLSSDKRSTRCTLGLKHKLGRNNIDQVAKYFMDNGPMTGNIFRAPPLMGKSSDCVGASRIITQPAETYELRPVQPQYIAIQRSYVDTQPLVSNVEPQQFVSSPHSDCVGAQQHQMVSSPTPKQYSAPKQSVFSPPQQQTVPSPKSDESVGAPHQIITQPKDTMPETEGKSSPQVSSSQAPTNNCGPSVGQAAPGAVNPLNVLGVPNLTPTLLQILGQQLNHPMFGIPRAIESISKSSGIGDLVSAPGHLLTGIAQRLGLPETHTLRTSSNAPKSSNEDTVGTPRMENSKSSDDCGSTLGLENPASNVPTISYLNPGFGTPYVSLFSPTVGAPWNPTVGAAAPGQISYMNPTVGAPAPTHISYVHQIPTYTAIPMIPNTMMNSYVPHMPATTYIVGSPLSMPFYNTASSPVAMQPSDTTLEETFKYEPDQHVGKPKTAESPTLKQQKKICKKSNKEEAAKKITRDVKGVSESITDEEIEKQSKIFEAANKQTTTELPKIERTTTQRPAIGKSSGQKTKVERSAARADKVKSEMIGKIKPAKEITKKPKGDKKSIDRLAATQS